MHLIFNCSAKVRIICGPVRGQKDWAWWWPKSSTKIEIMMITAGYNILRYQSLANPGRTNSIQEKIQTLLCSSTTTVEFVFLKPADRVISLVEGLKARLLIVFKWIYGIYLKFISRNQQIYSCNRLDLEIFGFQPILPQIFPDHVGSWNEVNIDTCWREGQSAYIYPIKQEYVEHGPPSS